MNQYKIKYFLLLFFILSKYFKAHYWHILHTKFFTKNKFYTSLNHSPLLVIGRGFLSTCLLYPLFFWKGFIFWLTHYSPSSVMYCISTWLLGGNKKYFETQLILESPNCTCFSIFLFLVEGWESNIFLGMFKIISHFPLIQPKLFI